MDFLKSIGGKIVTGLVALGVVAAAISWFQMDPANRHVIVADAGRIAGWFGIVIALPWISFALIGVVAKLESNLAGAILVSAYTVIEAVVLAWLFNWALHGAMAIVFFVAAGLLAGAYNLFTCDWIAEKL
jgi:FtsH-binding integral membrane protein